MTSAVIVLTALASAQGALPVDRSTARSQDHATSLFGRYVATVEDCNADGVADFVVGVARARHPRTPDSSIDVEHPPERGQVWLYDGATFQRMFVIAAPSYAKRWSSAGMRVSADFDGDGTRELAVSCESTCATHFVSLKKRREVFKVNAGLDHVVPTIDWNHDGRPDVLVGGERIDYCLPHSGADGEALPLNGEALPTRWTPLCVVRQPLIPDVLPVQVDASRGVAIASSTQTPDADVQWLRLPESGIARIQLAIDLNMDGHLDWICRQRWEDAAQPILTRALRVYDGKTGALRAQLPYAPSECVGENETGRVAAPGDVNGDGVGDLVFLTEESLIGAARCLSGADGKQLWASPHPASGVDESQFSGRAVSISTFRDVDGDGAAELLLGSGTVDVAFVCEAYADGTVFVLSGRTGQVLHSMTEEDQTR